MTKNEFLNYNFSDKNIIIIGKPSSGKTYISELLNKKLTNHKLIHTDDFKQYNEDTAINHILNVIKNSRYHIIEGMLGYRLLLRGIKYKMYYPDIMINIKISFPTLIKSYTSKNININSIKGFCIAYDKMLKEFLNINNSKIEVIDIKNDDRLF